MPTGVDKIVQLLNRKGGLMRTVTHSSTKKTSQSTPRRLILSFVALASAAVVGAFGIANAAHPNGPSAEWCKKNGFEKNHGQCVSAWNHQKPKPNKPGHGYPGGGGGNGNEVNTNIDLEVNGDDNVINIMLHYVFG